MFYTVTLILVSKKFLCKKKKKFPKNFYLGIYTLPVDQPCDLPSCVGCFGFFKVGL